MPVKYKGILIIIFGIYTRCQYMKFLLKGGMVGAYFIRVEHCALRRLRLYCVTITSDAIGLRLRCIRDFECHTLVRHRYPGAYAS